MVIRRFWAAVIAVESQTAIRINTIIWAMNGIKIVKKTDLSYCKKGFWRFFNHNRSTDITAKKRVLLITAKRSFK